MYVCYIHLLVNSMAQGIKRSSTLKMLGHVKNFLYPFSTWRWQQSQAVRDNIFHKWVNVASPKYLEDRSKALWGTTLRQSLYCDWTEKQSKRKQS